MYGNAPPCRKPQRCVRCNAILEVIGEREDGIPMLECPNKCWSGRPY